MRKRIYRKGSFAFIQFDLFQNEFQKQKKKNKTLSKLSQEPEIINFKSHFPSYIHVL